LFARLLSLNEDSRLGDFSDLADRLELAAGLHMELGEWGKAVRLLVRAKRLAQEHGFPFGGAELLTEARSNA
jgi:hypothetical protein